MILRASGGSRKLGSDVCGVSLTDLLLAGLNGSLDERATWLPKLFEQLLFSLLGIPAYGLLELIAAACLSCRVSCFLWSEEINRGSMGDLFLGVERASVLLVEGEIISPPSRDARVIPWGCHPDAGTSCAQVLQWLVSEKQTLKRFKECNRM